MWALSTHLFLIHGCLAQDNLISFIKTYNGTRSADRSKFDQNPLDYPTTYCSINLAWLISEQFDRLLLT